MQSTMWSRFYEVIKTAIVNFDIWREAERLHFLDSSENYGWQLRKLTGGRASLGLFWGNSKSTRQLWELAESGG